jgi:glycosyltransferase involved in cell wall biosynthesis
MSETIIVIPCYDEAGRLPADVFSDYVRKCNDVDFVFVNDGSGDATLDVLRELESSAPDRFLVLDQQPNRGKAEAVRIGMNEAFERGARYAGYFDADLSTPLDEIARLAAVLDSNRLIEMVFGARVQLLGRRIERHSWRHYLGRVFATAASETLDLPIYDTQCGAKLFRVTPTLHQLFAEPFLAGWFFDVEIVARRIALARSRDLPPAAEVIYELPLMQWIDVPGSKLRPSDFARAFVEILRVHRRYLARSAPPFGAG